MMMDLKAALKAAGEPPEGYEALPVNFGVSMRDPAQPGGFVGDWSDPQNPVYRWTEPHFLHFDDWCVYFIPKGLLPH